MLRYYEGNVIAALQHVYPQLEFNPKKFVLHRTTPYPIFFPFFPISYIELVV